MEQPIIPNKLYGRESELATLLESFDAISKGRGKVLLIPGSSGVGKTSLVDELAVPVRNRNGFFIKGKFDQYQQNIPYSALRQALYDLLIEILSQEAVSKKRIKQDLLKALGQVGQVLIDLVPEYVDLIGPQQALESISPIEAKHRFAEVFRHLLSVICLPEHPLVLFIDDWQWADRGSFELMKQMQPGTGLRYFLIIMSYRDDEISALHPMSQFIEVSRAYPSQTEFLRVNNITLSDVTELLHDTFKPKLKSAGKLAAVVLRKTKGNPFFVHVFVEFLLELGLIWFEEDNESWIWNIDPKTDNILPENIVDLFVQKLRRLDLEKQELYSLAACLGSRFDVRNLSIISGKSISKIRHYFDEVDGGAVVKALNTKKQAGRKTTSAKATTYSFFHDKLQQAAYTLIEPAIHPEISLKIGRTLLNNLQPSQITERIFELVNLLNVGFTLVTDKREQVRVIELNISAARKAYMATAYDAALLYYRLAAKAIIQAGLTRYLQKHHRLLLYALYKELAECEFMEGNQAEAEQLINESVVLAETPIEKADALKVLIVQYTLLARYTEAIEAGRNALQSLNITLPFDDFEKARDEEISKIRAYLKTHDVASLSDLPVMSDPNMLMASKLLITIGPPCYRSHQRLWGVIVPKVVNLTIAFGNISQIGYSHTAFGGLLAWVDDDFKTAKAFGELATKLMNNVFRLPSDQSVFYLMIGSSIRHWFKHLKHGSDDYTEAYEIGLQSGNLQYAAYAFGHNMYCRFYQGTRLNELIEESKRSLIFSKTRHNQWAIDLLEGGITIFSSLEGQQMSVGATVNWSEKNYLKRVQDHKNIQVECIYKVLQSFSLMLMGAFEEALSMSDKAAPIIYTVGTQGLLPWPMHIVTRTLIIARMFPKAKKALQKQWKTEVSESMRRLQIWAENCPENFEPGYFLAKAEWALAEHNLSEAIRHYDLAIEAAKKSGFIQWEGLANERAFDFWQAVHNERISQVYWQQAYVCYFRWGAMAKINQLEEKYSIDLANDLTELKADFGTPLTHKAKSTKDYIVEKQLIRLREFAIQTQESRQRAEALTHADELAIATQRLRIEIAERKKSKEEITLKNLELEKLNREKDKFFSIIAHDLRSPFNSFLGLTEIMAKELPNLTMDQIQQIAGRLKDSATKLYGLLENLLHWARSQRGMIPFNPEKISLIEVVDESVRNIQDTAIAKEISISISVESKQTVFADRQLLMTILRNILSNAVKFTSKGGKVSLSATAVKDKGTEICITDTGIGMNQTMLSKLFKLDNDTNRSGTNGEPSSGLGLLLCREFVRMHGGTIRVESKEMAGTTFCLTFPQKQ